MRLLPIHGGALRDHLMRAYGPRLGRPGTHRLGGGVVDEEALAPARCSLGCYVLSTNRTSEGLEGITGQSVRYIGTLVALRVKERAGEM